MMIYPLGMNENKRLQALSELAIVRTPPDPVMDRIVKLVCDFFQAPMAIVAIIDNQEQWFKACVGLNMDGTPREQAFCNWTILSDEVFVVEDAAASPLFKDNPLVLGGAVYSVLCRRSAES